MIRSRAYFEDLFITGYIPTETDWDDLLDTYMSLADDMGDNTVMVKLPSAAPVGLGLGASTVLGRKASGNLEAISFADLIAALGVYAYSGTWNANTNSPALASGVGTQGVVYRVSTAGTTSIDGVAVWSVGDHIAFNGTIWEKWDGVTNEVISFNTRTGAITLVSGDVTSALGFTPFSTGNVDTDGTLAANSDTKVASQKATKTYIDTGLSGKQNSIGYTAARKLTKAIFTPTNGSTITGVANQLHIINPAGDLASLTVDLPLAPNDGDICEFKYIHAITTLTYALGTVVGASNPSAGTYLKLIFDQGTTSWY